MMDQREMLHEAKKKDPMTSKNGVKVTIYKRSGKFYTSDYYLLPDSCRYGNDPNKPFDLEVVRSVILNDQRFCPVVHPVGDFFVVIDTPSETSDIVPAIIRQPR